MPRADIHGVDDPDALEAIRQVGRAWGWVLAFGIATLVIGVIMLIRPKHTTLFFAALFGIWLLVAGVFRIVTAIARHPGETHPRWLQALLGLLAVLIGILVLRHKNQTVEVLGVLVGVFWVLGGISEIILGFETPDRPARPWLVLAGVIGTIVGILALVYPGLSLWILTLLLGIWLIFYGIVQILVSNQLRALRRETT